MNFDRKYSKRRVKKLVNGFNAASRSPNVSENDEVLVVSRVCGENMKTGMCDLLV